MANDVGSNPWVLDTAAASVLHANPVFIAGITWSNYAAAANLLIIQGDDGTGAGTVRDVIHTDGKADLTPIDFPFCKRIRNFTLKQLDAGIVTVWLK